MIKKGNLFQGKTSSEVKLVEVVRTYNKPDIDPECPESVAIVGMVEAVILSGPGIGKTIRSRRSQFLLAFSPVEEAK
tara:strand:+ start:198 stop:428 length:231 start_codon:yes stop_codon:yes gene_type:complete